MAVIPEHHDENGGGEDLPKPVFADPGGRRRVVRRIAIGAGAAASYGALLLFALSGVPDLPAALGPRPVPGPEMTPPPPTTTPPTTTDGPRTASPPESWGAPEPVRENSPTSARPAPIRTTASPASPDTRAPAASSQSGSDRRNRRAPEDPPSKAKTTPPKSGTPTPGSPRFVVRSLR
ncbi:hypothetical protein LCL61_31845 [Amycolatopsis coloradensis]|uniref:Uncharacterized protein n=1 Tax=Amycolatopsis coloradensis TaxID=76021 RepID=A0ACD5BL85_9PSEU